MQAEALTPGARDAILAGLRAWEYYRQHGSWPNATRAEFITAIADDAGEGLNWSEVRNLADGIGEAEGLILCRE